MSDLPEVIFDLPWLLIAALFLPLLVWWLRRLRQRGRDDRLGRFAEAGALSRLLVLRGLGPGARTARLIAVALPPSYAKSDLSGHFLCFFRSPN